MKQLVLGVTAATALSSAFQNAFTAALLTILPKGCLVVISSVQEYYDDGSIQNLRRILLRAAIGVQINYAISTPLASVSTENMQNALINPTSVSTVSSLLSLSYPLGSLSGYDNKTKITKQNKSNQTSLIMSYLISFYIFDYLSFDLID